MSLLIVIPETSSRNIHQSCIVNGIKFFSVIWKSVGSLFEHLDKLLSQSVPQSFPLICTSVMCICPVCIWGYDQSVRLSISKKLGVPSSFCYFMQMASLNSCWFSAYLIVLIGRAKKTPLFPFLLLCCCA